MTALQELALFGWMHLSSLPKSIGQLKALQELDLNGCEQLSSLLATGQLTAWQQLRLSKCKQLSSLLESIGQVTVLSSWTCMHASSSAPIQRQLGSCQQCSTTAGWRVCTLAGEAEVQ